MARLFREEPLADGDRVQIEDADAHYIASVLRLRAGDEIWLVTPGGREHLVRLDAVTRRAVAGSVVSARLLHTEPAVTVVLFQAVPKGRKFDLIVEKTTELGVAHIVPVTTERCVRRLDHDRAARQTERWRALAQSAARQSGRERVPVVEPPAPFDEALVRAAEHDVALLLNETDPGRPLRAAWDSPPASCALLVGPEGGLTQAETAQALAAGWQPVGLGPRILRTETAAIVAVGLILHELGSLE